MCKCVHLLYMHAPAVYVCTCYWHKDHLQDHVGCHRRSIAACNVVCLCKTDTTLEVRNSCVQTVSNNRMAPAAHLCSQPQQVSLGARVLSKLQSGKSALPLSSHWHLPSKSLARGLSVNTGHIRALDTRNLMSTVQWHMHPTCCKETHPCKPVEAIFNRVTE